MGANIDDMKTLAQEGPLSVLCAQIQIRRFGKVGR